MSNDIRSILERLTMLENKITPTSVKSGLNAQQKSVPQLPALFKPHGIKVLGSKKDPKHPMAGYAVGADESAEPRGNALSETMAEIEEDMLSKVKKDLTHYLDQLEQKVKADSDIKDKAVDSVVDKNPSKPGVQHKSDPHDDEELDENDYELTDPETVHDIEDHVDSTLAQPQAPVKTMECGPGIMFEIHGNEGTGFEIRRKGRSLPSKFKTVDDAAMACELFKARRAQKDQSADYIEER